MASTRQKQHLVSEVTELGSYGEGELEVQEELDILPLSDESLGALRRLARYKAPPDPYPFPGGRAAVMVALFGSRTGNNLNVLLSTRAKTMRTFPGQVACPGGKMDEEDINLEATARREAFEEIGLPINVESIRYLTTLPPFLARSRLLVTPVVFFVIDSSLRPELNPDEVDTLFSFPLSGFLSDKVTPNIASSVPPEVQSGEVPYHKSHTYTWLDGPRATFHSFEAKPTPVTGLTAEILIAVASIAYSAQGEGKGQPTKMGLEDESEKGALRQYEPPSTSTPHPPPYANLSAFPPRPPPSEYPSSYSNSSSSRFSNEPLLPYARHSAGPSSESRLVGSWSGFLSGRGRHRILILAAGACLVFFLHAHYYRDGPQIGLPPSWISRNPPDQAPGDATPPGVDHADGKVALSEDAELNDPPLLPAHLIVQPRREIRPTWPDPWSDLPKGWKGRAWLDSGRWKDEDATRQDEEEDEVYLGPPARYLMKAFEWAASRAGVMDLMTPQSRSVLRDETTGRAKIVPRKELYVAPGWKAPKLDVGQLMQKGVGAKALPQVQFKGPWDDSRARLEEETRRRQWVKNAFRHTWDGYKTHAWGHDELRPLTNSTADNYNGWGATIVDSLDTLLIMGLSNEYNLARKHVEAIDFSYLCPSQVDYSEELPPIEELDVVAQSESKWDEPSAGTDEEDTEVEDDERRRVKRQGWRRNPWESPTTIPTFETTIRYVGGLLSAYELSGDPMMLARAKELGDWILPSLTTEHGLAVGRYTLGSNPGGAGSGRGILSEVGSMSMEFTKLSMLTGDQAYFHAIQRSTDTLDTGFAKAEEDNSPSPRGRLGTLLPAYIDPSRPKSMTGEYTFGGLADSYYEYLIKEHQLLGGAMSQYERMYTEAIDSAYTHLIEPLTVIPGRTDLMIIGARGWGLFQAKLEHLTCFAGGMLALGSRLLGRTKDMATANGVTEACAWAYESSATGVGPEMQTFYQPKEKSRFMIVDAPGGGGKARKPRGSPMGVKSSDAKYIGRPETIESVFYMWRTTGDRKWQDRGWQMFTSWCEHSLNEVGFATLHNVDDLETRKDDSMESFVLAETLKYYYLLFSPHDFFSLDDWVFNTEAHPFRIPKPRPTPFKSLWTGPSKKTAQGSSFASSIGEGTRVQKWFRVHQAARLNSADRGAQAAFLPLAAPQHEKPVVPPDLLAKAKEESHARAQQMRKLQEDSLKPDALPAAAGLGRGFGGGGGGV